MISVFKCHDLFHNYDVLGATHGDIMQAIHGILPIKYNLLLEKILVFFEYAASYLIFQDLYTRLIGAAYS